MRQNGGVSTQTCQTDHAGGYGALDGGGACSCSRNGIHISFGVRSRQHRGSSSSSREPDRRSARAAHQRRGPRLGFTFLGANGVVSHEPLIMYQPAVTSELPFLQPDPAQPPRSSAPIARLAARPPRAAARSLLAHSSRSQALELNGVAPTTTSEDVALFAEVIIFYSRLIYETTAAYDLLTDLPHVVISSNRFTIVNTTRWSLLGTRSTCRSAAPARWIPARTR